MTGDQVARRFATRLLRPWRENGRVHALSIEQDGEAWYMFLLDADGGYVNDTRHKSLEEALEQGRLQFGVAADAWQAVPDGVAVAQFLTRPTRSDA